MKCCQLGCEVCGLWILSLWLGNKWLPRFLLVDFYNLEIIKIYERRNVNFRKTCSRKIHSKDTNPSKFGELVWKTWAQKKKDKLQTRTSLHYIRRRLRKREWFRVRDILSRLCSDCSDKFLVESALILKTYNFVDSSSTPGSLKYEVKWSIQFLRR